MAMRIHGRWSSVGWHVACVLLSVCSARPPREQANEMYIDRSRSPDSKSMASGYGYGEISASKSSELDEDSLEELEELDEDEVEEDDDAPSTMRAITTRVKSDAVLLPLIIEPEAEMLPLGYKGVKPPGVSHMELVFVKPQTGRSGRPRSAMSRASPTDDENPGESGGFERDRDTYYAQIARNERSEHAEASGQDNGYSERENRAGRYADGVLGKKDVTYETGNSRGKARNTAGYRDVYREDEAEKNAGFYGNGRQAGRQGGHFESHGRYGEKYAGVEGTKTDTRHKLEKTRAS